MLVIFFGAAGVAIVAAAGGCVEREMTITSQPPGALVFVSDKEIGRTPVTQPFLWYGDYEIVLRRNGCQTLHTHANLRPPIYEIFPLDLLSELAPWTYHDRRYLHFEMKPRVQPRGEEQIKQADRELISRAEALRDRNRQPVEK